MKRYLTLLALILATQNTNAQIGPFGGGDGYSEATSYELYTKQHIEELADSVITEQNTWSEGKYFKVMNDISDQVVTVIGSSSHPFKGNFDGQNYTITLAINDPNVTAIGLFGYANNSIIKNIVLDGTIEQNMSNNYYVIGGIVGHSYLSTISNCINNADVTSICSSYVGGIVGYSTLDTISGCSNYGNVTNMYSDMYTLNGRSAGGIVGYSSATAILDCRNYGNIADMDVNGRGAGGISGVHYSSSISNCSNYGNITSDGSYVGGIIGTVFYVYGAISDCINSGNIQGRTSIGGIVGNNWATDVFDCVNSGKIEGENYIGGIGGTFRNYGGDVLIYGCINTGFIIGSNSHTGGVAGNISNHTFSYLFYSIILENCLNTGDVKGSVNVGGITGIIDEQRSSITITNCINTGFIIGNIYKGGIVGYDNGGTIENCINTGVIEGQIGTTGAISGKED
ncbi:MAG: hypothetical protein FWG85_06535 [Bacteroidetes bacterium]|nr:hypothetical protein [Bacteroidota bacterium]